MRTFSSVISTNGGFPFLVSLALIFPIASANGASFDCSKASTLVESSICSSPKLSSLDDAMASFYSQALRQASSVNQIKESQRTWLKQRNKCPTAACIQDVYEKRITELRSLTSFSSVNTPGLPILPGDCVTTKIVAKNTRFEGAIPGDIGGEISVELANGISLYLTNIPHLAGNVNPDAYMARTLDFAKGDTVRLCLVSLPEDCPPGDDRGKVYSVTNKKNQMSFIGVDAWHLCGGA